MMDPGPPELSQYKYRSLDLVKRVLAARFTAARVQRKMVDKLEEEETT